MTLVAAWVQHHKTLRQLVIASDSRISGGESWDACPKLMTLPRPATVMAMSGDATEAYSFLLQALNTCGLMDGHESGRTDIGYFANKLRSVYADSRRHVRDLPFGETQHVPNLDVVLLGWSWRNLKFEGYSYRYRTDGTLQMSRLDKFEDDKAYGVHFFGEAAPEAQRRLAELKRARELPVLRESEPSAAKAAARELNLRWEPLEVLLDMIDDTSRSARTVGGVPQIIQIYQFGEAESFVWQSSDRRFYFGGRPVMPQERFDRRVMRMTSGVVEISFSDRSMAKSSGPDESSYGIGHTEP